MAGRHWGLILGPSSVGQPNKTGEFDESILFDWAGFEWMHPLFHELSLGTSEAMVWKFSGAELREAIARAALVGGVSQMPLHLYALRHGGASHDALALQRPLSSINKRGRWRCDASVRRYEKATLAQAEANKVPKLAQRFAKEVEASLPALLLANQEPPALAPPGARRRCGTSAASFTGPCSGPLCTATPGTSSSKSSLVPAMSHGRHGLAAGAASPWTSALTRARTSRFQG